MTPAEEAEVVRTHQPFIMKHAIFAARTSRRDLDDCVQDASIAFVKACRAWRADGGANIRTFATPYLRNAATSAWKADNAKRRQHSSLSMDAEMSLDRGHGDDTFTLHDVMGKPATQDVDLDEARQAVVVREALALLPVRERDVLTRRFYEGETLEEVSERWGIVRERIRQIEDEALDRLLRLVVRRGVSR